MTRMVSRDGDVGAEDSGEVGEDGRGQVGGGGPPASTTITVLPILPSGGGNSGRFRNVAKKGCRVTKVETH